MARVIHVYRKYGYIFSPYVFYIFLFILFYFLETLFSINLIPIFCLRACGNTSLRPLGGLSYPFGGLSSGNCRPVSSGNCWIGTRTPAHLQTRLSNSKIRNWNHPFTLKPSMVIAFLAAAWSSFSTSSQSLCRSRTQAWPPMGVNQKWWHISTEMIRPAPTHQTQCVHSLV